MDKRKRQANLNDLDRRIKEARKSKLNNIGGETEHEGDFSEGKRGARAGSEFLANVFAGAFIGYGIDWYFETTPWAVIFFILMGFVSGVYRANAAMKDDS